MPPKGTEVCGDLRQSVADNSRRQGVDRSDADVVAATDRESHPVTFETAVGTQYDIGCGVIRIGIHRVRTVEIGRGWKANVASGE